VSELNQQPARPEGLSEGIAQCSVICPMCGHRHVQYRLNPQLYWFTDMDIDRKPTGFHCRKSLEGYYPRLYELWHCPQCHYTAHNRVFPDPLKHVYIEKGLVGRRLAETRKSHPAMGKIIDVLGADTAFEQMGFTAAIRLALLDIYFQRLIADMLNQGHDSLARSYLRLAWLFRDWREMQPDRSEEENKLNAVLDLIQPDWPDCPRGENDALEQACVWFATALGRTASTQDPVESCSMMVQVARIRVKMGETEAARTQLNECHRSLVSDLETLTRDMNEDLRTGSLSEEERGRMLSDSRKLRSMMDECRTLKEDLAKRKATEERRRAQHLLASHPKASAAELRNLLKEARIPASLIGELVPERKERLFGGLFGS
jgi:hypothetical protein